MLVSVIIPVYRNWEGLQKCLRALQVQTWPAEEMEIIVVNNCPSDSVAKWLDDFPRVRLVEEPKESSYAARNKGLSVARGAIIAFTDSDCIPSPHWVENGVKRLKGPQPVGLVAGRVLIESESATRKYRFLELFERTLEFRQEYYISKLHFGVTANLFTTRTVIHYVGPFDESLKSGGDLEWGRRVYAARFPQVYASEVTVGHPARASLANLIGRGMRVAGGMYDWQAKPYGRHTLRLLARGTLGELVRGLESLGLALRAREADMSSKLVVCLLVVLVQAAKIYERGRIYFGGSSKRF